MIQFSRFSTEFSVTPPCLAIHDRNESRSLASPRQTKEKKLYTMTRSVIFSPSPIYVRHIYIHTRTYFSLRVALRVESLSFCWRQTGRAARRLGSFLAATKPSKVPLVAATPTTEGRERHACTRTRARTVSPFNPPRRALLEENGLENYFLEWWRRWNSLNSIKKKKKPPVASNESLFIDSSCSSFAVSRLAILLSHVRFFYDRESKGERIIDRITKISYAGIRDIGREGEKITIQATTTSDRMAATRNPDIVSN